jgi:KUP system potassium uptake protein
MTAAALGAPEKIEPERTPRRRAARSGRAALALGALGVVFGDIGTSPLYAVQAVFTFDNHAVHANRGNVYGVISLVFWSITLIVSGKYVTFIMRADDKGEGGIMALTALLRTARMRRGAIPAVLVTLGVVGASLFYGDSAITPAISVLSAVEGLKVAVPSLTSVVVPVTVVVLSALFAIQRFGTRLVGNLFGPVMAVWFAVLASIGVIEINHHPDVLQALSPAYGAKFLLADPGVAFIALGAVVLAVTGAEALYADMGHFGRGPIRRAWFLLVFPALTLDYLAQGSLIIRSPKSVANPFFLLLPGWAQLPMVLLATAATVIASQAVISGAFSVTQQAAQLGFLPRLTIRHTSEHEIGQIYAPAVNTAMFATVVAIVIGFGSATALADAYGVAVTGTFVLTTILFLAVARLLWHKPRRLIVLGAAVFLTTEVTFFAANLTKITHGGWLPLVIALTVFTILMTWQRGREIVSANRSRAEGSLRDFVEEIAAQDMSIRSVPGIGVFLSPNLQTTPLALRANVERNHILHDHVILVSVEIERVPHIPDGERFIPGTKILFSGATGDPLGSAAERITPITLRFGYLDEPDVPSALRLACERRLIDGGAGIDGATYFLSQITISPTDSPGLGSWTKKLFITIARNAASPAEYFRLPDDRTVTTSGRIQL